MEIEREDIYEAVQALEDLAETKSYVVLTRIWEKALRDAEVRALHERTEDRERLIAVVRRNVYREVLGTREQVLRDLNRKLDQLEPGGS